MFFGAFGAIFLMSQYFQAAQGFGPFEAGARTLPWTAMPMLVAPMTGLLATRFGTRPVMAAGLGLQAVGIAWMALVIDASTPFVELIGPFGITGIGMALVFPTAPEAVMAAVGPAEAGKASGATNAIREIGAVLGVAVLASVFAAHGGYDSPEASRTAWCRRCRSRSRPLPQVPSWPCSHRGAWPLEQSGRRAWRARRPPRRATSCKSTREIRRCRWTSRTPKRPRACTTPRA